MIKRILKTVMILFVILIIGICVYKIKNRFTYSEIIQKNWGIELPTSYEEVYSTDSGASFLGDGERYHVFQYDSNEEVKNALNWQSIDVVRIDGKVKKILSNLNILDKYAIDFAEQYKYYYKTQEDSSIGYFIWQEENKRIYIIERFQ